MSSCPINQLPQELIIHILQYVGLPLSATSHFRPNSSLIHCLLCCRQWYKMALQMIYKDTVLHNHNTTRFVQHYSATTTQNALKMVRSFTISLDPQEFVTGQKDPTAPPTKEYDDRIEKWQEVLLPLQKLPAILAQMTNLSTFSLSIANCGKAKLRNETIGSILAALPKSCVNLELDIENSDPPGAGTGHAHPCEMIASLLPQLHHLRLHMGPVCPSLCGPQFATNGSVEDQTSFQSPVYPSLRTLIINCNTIRGGSFLCNNQSSVARIPLANSLRDLVLRASFPKIDRLWLLDSQGKYYNDNSTHPAWKRRDIVNNKTWAMPWTSVRGTTPSQLYYVIRLPGGKELLTTYRVSLGILAEEETWKETTTGSRIPSAVLASSDDKKMETRSIKPSPAMTVSEYQQSVRPMGSCLWWYYEKLTGIPLIWAAEKEGLVDDSPAREITPPGWKREVTYEGGIGGLIRDDSTTSSVS